MSDNTINYIHGHALVIGATGLVGRALVQQLQNAPEFSSVTVIVRKEQSKLQHLPKVKQWVMHDFLLLNDQDISNYSHVFSCLGSTLKQAGSKLKFYATDYEINAHVADLLTDKTIHFLIVSALGANAASHFFYNRVKGQLDDYLLNLSLSKLSIFRPSLLLGERTEQRKVEAIAQKVAIKLNQLWQQPYLYKPVTANQVAKAMVNAAYKQEERHKIYDNLDIQTMK